MDFDLRQILDLCKELSCTFTLCNDWYPQGDIYVIQYEWRVESNVRGRSNANSGYERFDECVAELLAWLKSCAEGANHES